MKTALLLYDDNPSICPSFAAADNIPKNSTLLESTNLFGQQLLVNLHEYPLARVS